MKFAGFRLLDLSIYIPRWLLVLRKPLNLEKNPRLNTGKVWFDTVIKVFISELYHIDSVVFNNFNF